jgi:small subunit ribosomal protein S20
MPHTNSAKKRVRQNVDRRAKNRAVRSKIRTEIKKAATTAASEPKSEAAEKAYRKAAGELDKAARRGLIKKNEASRRKARMAKARNAASASK